MGERRAVLTRWELAAERVRERMSRAGPTGHPVRSASLAVWRAVEAPHCQDRRSQAAEALERAMEVGTSPFAP